MAAVRICEPGRATAPLNPRIKIKLSMRPSTTPSRYIEANEIKIHAFLTSVVGTGEWSASRSGHFNSGGKSHRYLLDIKFGEARNRSKRKSGSKNAELAGNRIPAVQFISAHITDAYSTMKTAYKGCSFN
jgi:hypothetical protein